MHTFDIFSIFSLFPGWYLLVAAFFSCLVAFQFPFLLLSFHFLSSFLQLVPTYEIFFFVSEWISPPWWQLSSHSWLPFCFLSFSSPSSTAKYSRRYSIYYYHTLDTGHWTLDTVYWSWTLDTGHWTLDTGHWTLDTGHLALVHWTLDTGHRTLDTGHWTPDTVHRTLFTGHWTPDTVHRTLYTGHCTPDTVHRTLYTGHCTPDTVHRTLYTGHCTPDIVHRTRTLDFDIGHWTFDSGYYNLTLDTGN